MTKTANVDACPGKCIHSLASLMCDEVPLLTKGLNTLLIHRKRQTETETDRKRQKELKEAERDGKSRKEIEETKADRGRERERSRQ